MQEKSHSSVIQESERWLGELANDLALNYLDTSLSLDDLATKRRAKIEQVFEPATADHLRGEPTRNILLLGAGASLAAFGSEAFPGAYDAMDIIDEKIAKEVGPRPAWVQARIDHEKDRLLVAYGYEEAKHDFETHVAILSTIYSPQVVANTLADMYHERYWPHLTFEIIAHLLKHRFIDVVINFNFDELLDQAVDEELGGSQYYYVISDGQCQTVDGVMVGNRLKVPIHIKPHGTASHTSTLRFTKEHYFTLPETMRRFMQNIVGGYTNDDSEGNPYPVNIISVGFGMRSLDLLKMLRFSVSNDNKVVMYHLNTDKWARDNVERLVKSTGVAEQRFIDVGAFEGLHNTLRRLVTELGSRFQKPYKPRGIARHELIHSLFFDETTGRRVPSGGNGRKNDADYLRARLCAELAINLAKGKGHVDLAALVDDRVGTYFDHLREQTSRLFPGKSSTESIANLLGFFNEAGYPLWLGGVDRNILSARYPNEWRKPEHAEQRHGEWLWDAVKSALEKIGNHELTTRVMQFRNNVNESTRIAGLFQTLIDADTRDINANFRHRHLLLASEPNPDEIIHTNLSFALKFAQMLHGDWDVMLAISEYGRVLERCLDLIGLDRTLKKRFCIVLAQTDHEDGTDLRLERFSNQVQKPDALQVEKLPFWLHNHHMVIVLKRDPRKRGWWEYLGGIRYERRGLGNRIKPVYLHETEIEDLKRLVYSFFGYVWEARNSDWSKRSMVDSVQRDQIEKLQKDLFEEWWDNHEDYAHH